MYLPANRPTEGRGPDWRSAISEDEDIDYLSSVYEMYSSGSAFLEHIYDESFVNENKEISRQNTEFRKAH